MDDATMAAETAAETAAEEDCVDARDAETYASWFACLADATRIRIVHLLATEHRPMRVGEIVDRMDVAQSTVSHHLRRLADTGFVLVEDEGTARLYRVNDRCLDCFPSAADVVMGRAERPEEVVSCEVRAPWMTPLVTSGERP